MSSSHHPLIKPVNS